MRAGRYLVRLLTGTLIAGLCLSSGLPAGGDFSDLEFQELNPGLQVLIDPTADGVSKNISSDIFFENGIDIRRNLSIQGIWEQSKADRQGQYQLQISSPSFNGIVDYCETFQESFCDRAAREASVPGGATWILGWIGQDYCRSESDFYCIEGLSRKDPESGITQELDLYAVGKVDVDVPSENEIPRSARNVMFVDKANPDLIYEVSVEALAMWDKGALRFANYSVDITPTRVEFGDYKFDTSTWKSPVDRRIREYENKSDETCAWIIPGQCGRTVPFDTEVQLGVTVRLPKSAGGWFVGRVANPGVEILTASRSDTNRMLLWGSPVRVPSIFLSCGSACMLDLERDPAKVASGHSDGRGSGEFHLPFVSEYGKNKLDLSQVRSSGYSTLWSLSLFGMNEEAQIDYGPCGEYRGQILGISGSSALLMQSTPPARVGTELVFKVAGVHYNHVGQVEYGSYSAFVNSGFLSCVSGQRSAPSSASISVIAGSNGEVVSTNTVNIVGPWVKLESTNLTFSEKQIRFSAAGRVLITLRSFAPEQRTISSKHTKSIRTKFKNLKRITIVCEASYSSDGQKSAAVSRAKAACNFAKRVNPNLSTKSVTRRVPAGSSHTVVIRHS